MKALIALLFLLAAAALPAVAAEPPPEAELRRITAATVERQIRPGFDALAEAAAAQERALQALCDAPSPAALAAARQAFADTLQAWSRVEFLRLGPMTEANRADRILFWPDRKGITLRQVQAALAKEDPALPTPEGMAAASVALQGLPALEYLLWGDGADALAQPPAGYRCTLAAAVGASIARIAIAAAAEWRDPAGFSAILLQPGPDNPMFRTAAEAASRIADIPGTGMHGVQDQKLRPWLGSDAATAQPARAPFRRSGLTALALQANVEGIGRLAELSGLSAAVQARDPALQAAIATVQGNLVAALADLPVPLAEAATDPAQRSAVNRIALLVARLRGLLQDEMPAALGLKLMFNAYDGD